MITTAAFLVRMITNDYYRCIYGKESLAFRIMGFYRNLIYPPPTIFIEIRTVMGKG